MQKQWRIIREAPNYEISDHGDIRRLTNSTSAKRGRLIRQTYVDGYRKVTLCIAGQPHYFRVHRLVLSNFIGPSAMGVNHKNGKRDDNRLENLEYCSQMDNVIHYRTVLGWQNHGSLNGNAKLNESSVREIFDLRASGMMQKDIAAKLGTSRANVCRILKGKMWGHVSIAPQVSA
jgi:hypothetical protein